MPDFLILRLDAPLVSFGGVRVDARGPTQDHPTLSMIAGLLANALGYGREEAERHGSLQRRLHFAARCDRPGARLVDFQTVDITQPFMAEPGWTTRGAPEGRAGGAETRENLHIRHREYWADAVFTVAVALEPETEDPDVDAVERALWAPERPLFVGRKPCLPAAPVLLERRTAASLLEALAAVPRLPGGRGASGPLRAWLPDGEATKDVLRTLAVTDERDWANQIVVGRRLIHETRIDPPEAKDAR